MSMSRLHWPDKPEWQPDARQHAMVIMDEVQGDWHHAQECVMAMVVSGAVTVGYAQRLLWLTMPHGEC